MIDYKSRLFAIAFIWALNSPTIAGPILEEVAETMMEVNAIEMLFIGQNFGVDNNGSIQFHSNVNTDSRSFSYSTIPNQTHRGTNLFVSSMGAYDNILGEYIWTSNGMFGNQMWSSHGTVKWVGDPMGTFAVTFEIDPGGNNPITVNVTADVEYTFLHSGTLSSGTYTYSSDNGTNWGPFPGTDFLPNGAGTWHHEVKIPKTNATPNGISKFTSGLLAARGENGINFDGDFNVNIRAIPQPATLLLILIGTLCLGSIRRSNKLRLFN